MWIPQKRLVSHSNKRVSSQIKSTCSVTIKVVNKCLLYIRRISLTSQKGHFDLFPTWYKPFSFSLINTKRSKRFCFIMFQKAATKRCACVYFFSIALGEEGWSSFGFVSWKILNYFKNTRILVQRFHYKCPHEQSIDVISRLCELEGSCTSKEAGKV